MGGGGKVARFRVPGLTDFIGEEFLIPTQQYCAHLSTRVNLYHHRLDPILCR